jgi:CheY-like chemotaxis protein
MDMPAEGVAAPKPVVLVVEDEVIVQLDAADVIEAAGYEVVKASSADEAFEILTARNDIRVVFTDIEMPGSMDGLRLAKLVREKWPPVELIVTSGKHKLTQAELPERGVFMGKPSTPKQVTDALHAVIS